MGLASKIKLLTQRARIVPGNTTANWNSGVATSGAAGGDLFTFGAANQWIRLVECSIIIGGLTPGATITFRSYRTIAGVERLWGGDNAVVGVDPDLYWLWGWWNLEILGVFRCEIHSDAALDDGAAITYEYAWKNW